MKNLKKVAQRIRKAVRNNEKIVLYGDADLDGVTSAIMLEETIEDLGGKAKVYISNRKKWGYGLSEEAVLGMKKEAPALLLSLDCGISNFEGAEKAKKEGFELVIVDHHKALSRVPEASLILDPMQKGDKYPFKKLANAGVVYKLVEEVLGELFKERRRRFLELTSLATVADMVPREADNKEILDEGLKLLKNPSIVSLTVLKEKIKENLVDKTISLLNVTEPKKNVNEAYLFLTEEKESVVEEMIENLTKRRKKRKKEIEKEEKRILKKITGEEDVILEKGLFPSHLTGSIASRIIKEHKKPVFIYVKEGKVLRGSVRVPHGKDAVEAMSCCSKHLQSYGGHPVAAGFIVEKEDVENLKNCLINYFQKEG